MATRTVKSDSGNDLKLQNNGGTGSVTITDAGDLTIDSPADIVLDAEGADVTLKDGGTTYGTLKQVSGDLVIQPTTSKQIILNEDGGAAALTIDTDGNTEIAQNIEQADGKNIQTDEVRARDGDGLKLYEDGGDGIFVEDGGQVGIGTTSPQTLCEIYDGGSAAVLFINGAGASGSVTAQLRLGAISAGGGNEVARVTGKRGGDTTGTLSLHVKTAANTITERMTVHSNGNIGVPGDATAIYNASDKRLKENITNLSSCLDKITQMQGVQFNWIPGFCDDDENKTKYGLIAQDVYAIDSNLVNSFSPVPIEVGELTIENPLTVNEKQIIPMLVEAVKELSVKVNALENA